MKIIFKTKPTESTWYDSDFKKHTSDSVVSLPVIKRHHCIYDGGTRCDRYSNSNMLPAMVQRRLKDLGLATRIDLNNLPKNVTVSGKFLKTITIAHV